MAKLDVNIYEHDQEAQWLLAVADQVVRDNPVAPESIDPQYKKLVPGILAGHVAIIGAPQMGKSTAILHASSKLRLPARIFTCRHGMRPSDVLGKFVPNSHKGVEGDEREFVFAPGPLIDMFEKGGIFAANEMFSLYPDESQVFMPFLDETPYYEVDDGAGQKAKIKRHPNFRFVCTGNPHTQSAKDQDEALASRFNTVLYLSDAGLPQNTFIMMCKRKWPEINNEFFKASFTLCKAIENTASEDYNVMGVSCGIRQLTGLIGHLYSEGSKITKDNFALDVQVTLYNALGLARIPYDEISKIRLQDVNKTCVNIMFQEWNASMAASQAKDGKGPSEAPLSAPTPPDGSSPETKTMEAAIKDGLDMVGSLLNADPKDLLS